MNKCIIKGRLTRDPELKTSASGIEVCRFSVAGDRRRQKDKAQQTDFFDCTAFGDTGVAVSKFFHKGKEILLRGRMESSKVTKDDQTRTYGGLSVDAFEFCGSKGDSAPADAPKVDTASGMPVVETEELPF